ncbi:MAG: c-type cytochrome [Terriglobia bacterium]
MPEPPLQDDPIVSRSMSGPLLVASVLLIASLTWALYDEFYGLRPWKSYQQRFVQLYTHYLQKRIAEQAKAEADIRKSEAFQRLEQELKEANAAVAPRKEEIDREIALLNRRISALTDLFATARGEVGALLYQAETASSEGRRVRLLEQVEKVKEGPFAAELPVPDGTLEAVAYNYDELLSEYDRLKQRRAFLIAEAGKLLERANTLRDQRNAYLKKRLVGLNQQQLRGLLNKMRDFPIDIKQIHVRETNLVDRCESCHLGIREPVRLTPADMGGEAAFTTHPNRELLRIHDPERFGCSPCHGGNGRATSSVIKAHGQYKHWLWPLYDRENVEAGCQSCHARDMVLEHARLLNRGKELYRLRGCIGCHRYEGFDDERERLQAARQKISQLQRQKSEYLLKMQRSIQAGDQAATGQEAQRLYARAENLRVSSSGLDAEIEQLRLRERDLLREEKIVGPNLKEIRLKLRRDWIPVWISNPHKFRPTTKMPRFRLEEDQVQAIAAFLWQNALEAKLPRQARGNVARGKQLFETRGCMACHSIGEGENAVGGSFAANLSRVGEKASYDYLVRWISNPRPRTRPYCPLEKRDLTPEDYAQHGLPFRFDAENATCPNDGEPLRVQQMTVMPNLRLTPQEARDIASFLMTQRRQDPDDYPPADYMEDTRLFERGKSLVRNYGCAGCHEIAGLEAEDRIGTDLTAEGSKPIERLDFALLTHEAKREGWYSHKGFFEHKLANPAVFDRGKIKENPLDRLRMPRPNLTEDDITALTTVLLGSVEPGYGFPSQYIYRPSDQRRDIQEGWWIVTKYNCMGCHQIRIGQPSVLMTLPRYQTLEGREQLPPNLVGAGARLNPKWLAKFLANPALSKTNLHRNGVRSYLKVRMPTFSLTVGEIQKLVRFFAALSAQAQPYLPPKLAPLSEGEWRMARQLFTDPAAPCLKCHATGDPVHDRNVNAPNFLLAKERLKSGWTRRWLLDPASIIPGTAMPSELFRREGDRWVLNSPHPEGLRGYRGDHADLLVRYMFQITPEEQRRLVRLLAAAPAAQSTGVRMSVVKSQ